MRTSTGGVVLGFAVVAGALVPAPIHAQLPFAITRQDLTRVDTTSLEWRSLQTSVGGVEGELLYLVSEPSVSECKAAALLGGSAMRDHYVRVHGERPLTLRLDLRCAQRYRALLRFDGLALDLELRDAVTGAIIYQGRHRGFP